MLVREVLEDLNLGNSVAEFDASLEKYFVETTTFRRLIRNEADIVAGDKGTGKTALFLILNDRYTQLPELNGTEIVPAFNPSGNPVFQRLVEGSPLDEGQYINVWKSFILALVGNWTLGLVIDDMSESQEALDKLLCRLDLRSLDETPRTIFSKVINLGRRLRPKSVEATLTFSPSGIPVVVPRVEFGDPIPPEPPRIIPHEDAFALLDRVLQEIDLKVWAVFDRLDEAFQGFPGVEIPALRALFRTYLDLLPYSAVRLKLFVRRDLFRRIIGDGFVNLTHINARKIEITWDEADLWDLLRRRVAENSQFLSRIGLTPDDGDDMWDCLFPRQVDPGSRKPETWSWMMRRIRDGNDVRPPRNLIDLIRKAQDVQLRKEERDGNEFIPGTPLISSDALKQGLARLSEERVEDTLLAEAGDLAPFIEAFRGGKAEQNIVSLGTVLGIGNAELASKVRGLQDMGFLEKLGSNYKIPSLYRDGLGITQGKAFAADESSIRDDDE